MTTRAPVVGLAPDSFKGSLTADEAADAMGRGVERAWPDAILRHMPMADGGEGTAAILLTSRGGQWHGDDVTDPLGRPIRARLARLGSGDEWALDTASASGITLLAPAHRQPLKTCSFGTGALIRTAAEAGAKRLVLGLGGSATVDGGKGLCSALGFVFCDQSGHRLPPGAGSLTSLADITGDDVPAAIRALEIRIACDVRNPLLGPRGAAAVFGPQKGASPDEVPQLEAGLERLAEVLIRRGAAPDLARQPGTGAAGGIGAALVALLGAKLVPGAELVWQTAGYEAALDGCDFVIIGEGRLDAQTAEGKAPSHVASRAAAAKIPVLAVAGTLAAGGIELPGLVAQQAIYAEPPATLPASTEAATDLATATACLLARLSGAKGG